VDSRTVLRLEKKDVSDPSLHEMPGSRGTGKARTENHNVRCPAHTKPPNRISVIAAEDHLTCGRRSPLD
jgi:hypothetical protein